MTYRLRRAPPHYIEDDWSEQPNGIRGNGNHMGQHQPIVSLNHQRAYIDPWDLENYEYIQRWVRVRRWRAFVNHINPFTPPSRTAQTSPDQPLTSSSKHFEHSDVPQLLQHGRQIENHHQHDEDDVYGDDEDGDDDEQLPPTENDDSTTFLLTDNADNHTTMSMMMMMDGGMLPDPQRFDYSNGCYAGLDEVEFYNAKYESMHSDDPANSIYYTGE